MYLYDRWTFNDETKNPHITLDSN
jgi:hypothetical protein